MIYYLSSLELNNFLASMRLPKILLFLESSCALTTSRGSLKVTMANLSTLWVLGKDLMRIARTLHPLFLYSRFNSSFSLPSEKVFNYQSSLITYYNFFFLILNNWYPILQIKNTSVISNEKWLNISLIMWYTI